MSPRDTNLGPRMALEIRLVTAKETARSLLFRIQEIEKTNNAQLIEKISEIKMIREEISKVGTEIDSIKKEITLLNNHHLN